MLLQLFGQGCVIACHFKNYFCYHLPTRDEQELSLGMLIRCKRIYNFLCSMLVLHQFLYVLYALYDIYWTNLLTSATVPVSVYYVCLLQKRSKIESARKNLEKSQKFYFTRRLRKPEGGLPGGHGLARHGSGAPPLVATPGGCLVDSDSPSRRLFAYKSPQT